MKISPRIYAITLFHLLKDAPVADHKKVIKDFLKYLLKKRDFKIIDKIILEFEKYIDELSQVRKVELVSAHPLTEKNRDAIKDLVRKNLQVKQVNLVEKVDPALVGGVTIRWDDQIIDTSLKNRLWQLKKHLAGF